MLTRVSAGPFTIRGVSVGGIYTSLQVPELRSLFDVGIAARSAAAVDNIFLSHGHVDHAGALAGLLGTRALVGKLRPPRLFLPAAIEGHLLDALAAMARMQRYPLTVETVPLKPGDEVDVSGDLRVRAFQTFHPVPSLGFRLVRSIRKLRPEYAALPGHEIGRMRRAGEDLFDVVERSELAYATDTLVQVLDSEPELYDARVLILECTFLNERKPVSAAREGCHVHLDELLERASLFRNEAVVLMHFSQIYKPAEVHEILAARCPEPLRQRLVVFAPRSGPWPG